MAINKGTLAKEVNGAIEFIYPKSSADIILYDNEDFPTVSDALDELFSVTASNKDAAETALSNHNVSTTAHNDIRTALTNVTNTVTTLLQDVDDETLDQIVEIANYIKNNRDLINELKDNRVHIDKVYNALDSEDTTQVLAAPQGKALNDRIDAITSGQNATYEVETSLAAKDDHGDPIMDGELPVILVGNVIGNITVTPTPSEPPTA